MFPRIAGADVVLEELKTEGADVFPRITGAAALGALKGEAADVVPRIAGAEVDLELLDAEEVGVFPLITGVEVGALVEAA